MHSCRKERVKGSRNRDDFETVVIKCELDGFSSTCQSLRIVGRGRYYFLYYPEYFPSIQSYVRSIGTRSLSFQNRV